MAKRLGNHGNSGRLYFLGSEITGDGDCTHEIKRRLLLGRKTMTILGSLLKSRDIILPEKCPSSQSYGFSSSHVWVWNLDHKEGWMPKNSCFWAVALEKTLESPLVCKEIKSVNPKWNQPWIFIRWTDAEAEAPMLWPPDAKGQFIGKSPDAGKDWRQEAKGWQRMRWLDDINDSVNMSLRKSRRLWRTGKPGVHVVTKSQTRLDENNTSQGCCPLP